MSNSYRQALTIDATSSQQHLLQAAELLNRCEGMVMLSGVAALRATPVEILCGVIDPTPDSHRCEEEFKVLIENAARGLEQSRLAALLPRRPLTWRVVADHDSGPVQLWPAP